MSEKFNIPIAKHLEDVDDLFQGRDAELVEGQEQRAEAMADEIYQHALENHIKILMLAISPKKRAKETAELVEKSLHHKTEKLRIISNVRENLREIDQGRFILPEDYKPGDVFSGLKIAGTIFSAETFNPENPDLDNLQYRYGDPVPLADGSFKYPELHDYFSEAGESYKDVLLRFYSEVISLSEIMGRFQGKVLPVVFTHGQPHQIFKNLSEVAEKIEKENFIFNPGALPRICWDLYRAGRKGVIPFGKVDFISIGHICNPQMIDLLQQEIEYLKKLA